MHDTRSLKMMNPQRWQAFSLSVENISTLSPHAGHFFNANVGVPLILAAPGQET
jgi:hypothetical protein